MADPAVSIRKRFRSPPYPYLSLPKAIDRVGQLYKKAQHYWVGMPVLADAWELSPQSGGLLKSAAALIQYGLLTDQGSGDLRKFQLTDAARRIVGDADPASERRKELLKAVALFPSIHRELWGQFNVPNSLSDAVLKNYLRFDRAETGEGSYSDQAADEVIQNFREAITFVGLDQQKQAQPLGDQTAENPRSLSISEVEPTQSENDEAHLRAHAALTRLSG